MGKTAIITACYNDHPDLIWNHFVSIDQQYDDNTIHVVVDDCSTRESTRKALLAAAEPRKDRTVVISSKENGGPGAARNRAIRMISQMADIEFACLLDIDDYFELQALKVRRLMLVDDPNLIAVYGNKFVSTWESQVWSEPGEPTNLEEVEKILETTPIYDKPRLMRECYIPSCSVMFRWKPFLQHVKGFREDVRLCEDWLVWRKLSMLGSFAKVDMPIYTQTMHGGNLTTNPDVLAKHRDDMITTQVDFNEWLHENGPKGILKP